MSFIRTFHPVGQGAFYSEIHNFRGREFTIVYDCGSLTLKGRNLNKKITSSFPKNHPIDILFISHFHTDHINAISTLSSHCKINTVIMPLLDNDAKILVKISNYIDNGFSDPGIIDTPEDFFGKDVKIIKIKSIENELFEFESTLKDDQINDIIEPIDISKISNSEVYSSGTKFTFFLHPEWFYIPFNYQQEIRKDQFIETLLSHGIQLSDIDSIAKINKNRELIIKAYKDIDGNLNSNSMILFSGPNKEKQLHCKEYHYDFFFHFKKLQSGCLYTGDINLKDPNIVEDIKKRLGEFLPYIGTIQIPHHGSIHNFLETILETNYCCAVFSYGTKNQHGHPSDMVIGKIISNYIFPHFVTEEKSSCLIQWY